ncbi:hypothetical protein [Cellulomonas sp. ATA003]|uniref:hypothetical protein n=1 Tax=Cellulomonas sp. ATA003 TaxID=3073064 RepID=UPI002873B252|nr:hypothetical protein [Cellulomonas sp. ATA003]WNB84639.1 hypothetical protein REH70_12605 [Cellulomonas sp. ATA003]
MSDGSGERRRRRELARTETPAAGGAGGAPPVALDDDAAAPRPAGADDSPAPPVDDTPAAHALAADPSAGPSAQPRPVSRRELRERERRLTAPAPSAGSTAVGGAEVTGPAAPLDDHADAHADVDADADADDAPQHYTLRHYVAIALVAAGFGFLVWTLTTGADDAGATSAAWSTIPSLPEPPAAHQGEL